MNKLVHIAAFALCFSQSVPARAADTETAPVRFYADMTARQQPAAVYSDGTATVDLTLDRKTLQLNWTITFSGLTSAPTGLHIHNNRPGSHGPLIYDLTPKSPQTFAGPLSGTVTMSGAEFQYLLERHLYIDLHTEKYPEGEIRGHIERGQRVKPRK